MTSQVTRISQTRKTNAITTPMAKKETLKQSPSL